MTTAQQRLHHALDALDRAGTARPGPPVHGCEHCWTAEEFTLLAGPPALLPDRLLQSAAAKSADLWDDFPALYRRLTPVVLRKLTTGLSLVEGWVVATRLRTWADTATPTTDRHLADAADGWVYEGALAELRFGLHGELEVGAELTEWLFALPVERIGADRQQALAYVTSLSTTTS